MEEAISYRIPIQTLKFLTALPTRQDGVENRDKAYTVHFRVCFLLTLVLKLISPSKQTDDKYVFMDKFVKTRMELI